MSIIELDKPRSLNFGFSALRYLKTEHGFKNIDEVFVPLQNADFTVIPILISAFMIGGEDASLNLDEVDKLLDQKMKEKKYSMQDLVKLLEDVITESTLVSGLGDIGKKLKAAKVKKK